MLLDYITTNFQPIPGGVKSAVIEGHYFNQLQVFHLESSQSKEKLFKTYSELVPENIRVGKPTFRQVVDIMYRKGKSQAGLSTF